MDEYSWRDQEGMMAENYVDRCLRCGNRELRDFKRQEFEGIAFGQMVNEKNAVWCSECGVIYDDWGVNENRIRILRVLPKDICRDCGARNKGVDRTEGSWRVCAACGKGYFEDEFGWCMTATRGWVNAVNAGKFTWEDGKNKAFRKVEWNDDGTVRL